MIVLHMGGVFGDKTATLDRFRENYKCLSQDIKNRLVLENDDVSWSVHDLLPICEELDIPLVLDFHHHNIVFDAHKIREGTLDIMQLFERIKATWTRKGIRQKMHYSEPTPSAITPRQRRKHNARVATLPPCDPTMDLMIEAKDKEQAVFQLMRKFKLPGYDLLNAMIPHVREDENSHFTRLTRSRKPGDFVDLPSISGSSRIPDDEIGMGGSRRQVYWPPGKEEWLRPAKRLTTRKEPVTTELKRARTASRVSPVDNNGTAVLETGLKTPEALSSKSAMIADKKPKSTAKSIPAT
jgi:UV DNA damage endonuclease